MIISLSILWVIWCIPTLLYIIWKRGDWYLLIIPPAIISIIAILLSLVSECLGIVFIVGIHIFIVTTYLLSRRKSNKVVK